MPPMARPPYIAVKDWKKHQHYNQDRPAWIKLYGALLDDADFLALPELAQLQLIKLWLLASRMGHPLPNDPKILAGKIGCRGKFYLTALVESGLLLYSESREILDDSLGTKTEDREQRTEIEPSITPAPVVPAWQPIAEQRLGERLPTDAGRRALTVILQTPGVSKAGVVSSLTAILDGMHGTATPQQLETALIEYAAAGMSNNRWSARHFGGFLNRAKQPPRPEPAGSPQRADAGMLVNKIRGFIKPNPGRTSYLPKNEVAALGADVLQAYESVGGAERFIHLTPADLPFLIRDFNNALRGAA